MDNTEPTSVVEENTKKILPIEDNNYLLEKKSGEKIHFFYTGTISSEDQRKNIVHTLQILSEIQRPFIPQILIHTFVQNALWIGYEYHPGTLFSQKIMEEKAPFSLEQLAKIFYRCSLAIQSLHHLKQYGLTIHSECFIFDESYENFYLIHWAKNILFPDEIIANSIDRFSALEKDLLSLGYTFYVLVMEKKAALSPEIHNFFEHFYEINFRTKIDAPQSEYAKILPMLLKAMAQEEHQSLYGDIDELIEDIKKSFFYFAGDSQKKEKKYSSVEEVITDIVTTKFFFSMPDITDKMSSYDIHSSINFEMVSRIIMRDFYFSLFIFREANENNNSNKKKMAIDNIHNALFYVGIRRVLHFFKSSPSIHEMENKKKLKNVLELWTMCSFQGYIAEKICLVMDYSVSAEFVRLCTLFNSIGEFTVLTLLPDSWEKIRRSAAIKKSSVDEESQSLLSFSFSQISIALAKKYYLSEKITNFLKRSQSQGEKNISKNFVSIPKKIWGICHLAIYVSAIFSQFFREKSKEYVYQSRDLFSKYIFVHYDHINEILMKAAIHFLEDVEDVAIKNTNTYQKIFLFKEYGMNFFEMHYKQEYKKVIRPVEPSQEEDLAPSDPEEIEDFLIYMKNIQQDMSQADVQDILKNVKNFLQVELVVLCAYQPDIDGLLGTHAVGRHAEEYVGQFTVLFQETKNIFHTAVSTHTEVLVNSIDHPSVADGIPIWYRIHKEYAASFLFVPFKADAVCHHALFCGNKARNSLSVLPAQIAVLKKFANIFIEISGNAQ